MVYVPQGCLQGCFVGIWCTAAFRVFCRAGVHAGARLETVIASCGRLSSDFETLMGVQAGAAWPKLKPFVLEVLTTLVGKQVRHAVELIDILCAQAQCQVTRKMRRSGAWRCHAQIDPSS